MTTLGDALRQALALVLAGDAALGRIVALSLQVSLTATLAERNFRRKCSRAAIARTRGGGPMKVMPASAHAEASFGFSERKP